MPGKFNPKEIEHEILDYWKKKKIYEKLKDKTKKGKDFYYLDGPPYTSGKVHLGTAWGKALRDSLMRYKRMQGFNVWDRAGFDTHGLPTAHKVQEKFDIRHKDDIPKFGVSKFIDECKKLSIDNMKVMIEDFKKLGVWMGFDDPYVTLDNKYMEGEWWLIKKAHENNRLYEGEKVMHWCPSCSTALAKHELEYQNVKDDSIFLKFPLKDKKNEFLIIWTTTPWTIPYNLGVMVNPDEEYVKAKVDNEIWVVAAKLAGMFIQGVADEQYKVIETIKGEELEGIEYIHPLYLDLKKIYDKLKKENPKIHTVVLSKEYVDTGSGSGLVHMAPGCGPEDYEVGYKYDIKPFNNLNEDGTFPEEMTPFKKWDAKRDNQKFIEYFDKKGFLIKTTEVEHEYAHCWRCHKPVVFRLTKQWFFKIEDLKEEMRKLNKKILWQPDWAGSRQFDSWLDNLRDNSITRQRYWGCPVPIWKCECGNYEVIGSIKELEKKGNQKAPKDLHIPHIDNITIKCECGKEMKRIPDILDVWVDAGVASWTCLYYPQKKDLFDKLWPADFILEGKDQIRGWFNLLFVASMISMKKPSYKAVYMHGFINDAQGRKMSKSLGNYILPDEVVDKYGADTLRYYMIGAANPGVDLNYNFEDVRLKHKNLMILWNVHNYIINFCKTNKIKPKKISGKLGLEEKYILSKLNSTIENVTKLFDSYRLNEVPLVIEELFLELSRTYMQLNREKSAVGSRKEKELIASVIYHVLYETLKIFTPIAPFVCEKIYLSLKDEFSLKQDSISFESWPEVDKKKIDKKLEKQFEIVEPIVQEILSKREKAQLGIRWPLAKVEISLKDKEKIDAVKNLADIINTQTNVKKVIAKKGKRKSIKLDTKLTKELKAEGFTREVTRRIQSLRKKAGLKKDDDIHLHIVCKGELEECLCKFRKYIGEKCGASELEISKEVDKKHEHESKEKVKQVEFDIYFTKKN
jgi:isoleucyl-tRNA synthetase